MNIIWAEEMEDVLQTSRRGLYNRIRRGMLPKPLKISGRMCWLGSVGNSGHQSSYAAFSSLKYFCS